MEEVKDIKNITDVFKAAWNPNLAEQDGKVYYLRGVHYMIEVTHVKNSNSLTFKCFLNDKEDRWWINQKNLCNVLSSFYGIRTVHTKRENPNTTWSFSFITSSGEIDFINGTLEIREVTDFDAFVQELAKLNHLFAV